MAMDKYMDKQSICSAHILIHSHVSDLFIFYESHYLLVIAHSLHSYYFESEMQLESKKYHLDCHDMSQ